MQRIAMTDGSGKWFDMDKAQEFKEDTGWNGQNHISKATGSQTEHEILYYTASGKWILHSWSQWVGITDTWQIVSEKFVAAWLVTNDHAEKTDLLGKQISQLEI